MFRKLINYLIIILMFSFTFCSEHIIESTPSIDENEIPQEVASKFSEIQSEIFNPSCAFSGCHSSGGVNPDLSGNSYSRIVGKASSIGMNYIEPNMPNDSYLLLKILGGSSIRGSRMPLNSSPISQEKINALTNWINNGAKNN